MNYYYIGIRTSIPGTGNSVDHHYYVKASTEELAQMTARQFAKLRSGGATPDDFAAEPIDEEKYETGGIPTTIENSGTGTLRIAADPEASNRLITVTMSKPGLTFKIEVITHVFPAVEEKEETAKELALCIAKNLYPFEESYKATRVEEVGNMFGDNTPDIKTEEGWAKFDREIH